MSVADRYVGATRGLGDGLTDRPRFYRMQGNDDGRLHWNGQGLGWRPDIQPAGMPSITGQLAGLGDGEITQLDTILDATRNVVDTGLDIFQTVRQATDDPQTYVRTSTVRTQAGLAGGTGLILAGLAAVYFLGGKSRGRRGR